LQQLALFGTGGFGREVHGLIEDLIDDGRPFAVVGFLDGNPASHGTSVHGLPVLGDANWLRDHPDVKVALGIGGSATKRKVVEQVRAAGGQFVQLVHPRAVVGRRVELGEGTIVCAGVAITTDITIGSFCTFNLNVTIGHDSDIADFCTFAPGAQISGDVKIGEGTDFGTGATIIQGKSVGEWSIIGAGASIVNDIGSNVTAVGVPAKVIKERDAGWQF
jgi:sugar O-acyltransferase (sialic acid O-acetyltransferase NeuD family)